MAIAGTQCYYGEMEMRRRARRTSGGPADSPASTLSRGRVERRILTAYWLVSGYGLRAWRAVACLAVLTAPLAVLFYLVGFTHGHAPQPNTYRTSALYAFRATPSLTDNQRRHDRPGVIGARGPDPAAPAWPAG